MDHLQNARAAKAPPVEPCPRQGLITLFTGDGRGKTTAAIGTAVRAAGHGLRVLIVFFMKGPDFDRGEVAALKTVPNVTLRSFGESGWAMPGKDNTAHRLKASEALSYAAGALSSGSYDVMVLDEAVSAVSFGLLPEDAVTRLMDTKPDGLELILTGRGASAEMMKKSDLVTKMRSVKHPFDRGVPARPGIDY
jgi:cob(I)alamin adenosyltransferase